jgi:hypothetical protein
MKKPILELSEIKSLGFINKGNHDLDDGEFYRWWSFTKNDSEISITYEFNKKFDFLTGSIDFNGEELKGRTLTKKDIQLLIEIM